MNPLYEFIFWLSSFVFLLNYFIYPVIIIACTKFRRDPHLDMEIGRAGKVKVSFIIAAYNEDKVIETKIRNSLSLNYPGNNIEIIVVSDGSDDRTHEIASGFESEGVMALHDEQRSGKSAALNRGVSVSSGEVIVFSDANNDFHQDAILHLVKHFSDPEIGAVTGAKHVYPLEDLESTQGDGMYWKYESRIKQAESSLGCITSGDGEIFSIRKKLFNPIDSHLINDDAALTFDVVKQGYRVIYESAATSHENASKELLDDFHVKIRMTAGGFQTIAEQFSYLFPPRNLFSLQFLLHKVLRWLVPVFLILIYLTSLMLSAQFFFLLAFLLQSLFYGLALVGWAKRKTSGLTPVLYIPMYFSLMNLALLFGLFRHLKGQQNVQWRKAER